MWSLVQLLFTGGLPASVRPWFLGGRLIALRKEGDEESADATSRRLRPIAIGSTLARAVSMVAAHQYRPAFASFLQPPPPASGTHTTQDDGSPWPAQVGVACRSGVEFTAHSVRAILDEHRDWVDLALDVTNAFNSIHRRAFLEVVAQRFPTLWTWVHTCYGTPTELYVRRDGDDPAVIRSCCGTRQGDPLGAQLFALGLHPILCAISRLVGSRGVVIAYADDVHILAPPSVIAAVAPLLAALTPPPADSPSVTPPYDPRFLSAGLSLSLGKCSAFSPSFETPGVRERAIRTLAPAILALTHPTRHGRPLSLADRAALLLRCEGTAVARGHPVLGVPLGSDSYVDAFVQSYEDRATSLLSALRSLLVAPGAAVAAWDEYDALVRFCLWPRLRHFTRTLPPGMISHRLQAFQELVVDAHLSSIPPSFLTTHLDAYRLVQLPGRFGGHGIHAVGTPASTVSYHDAAWYGSWAAVWHYMRAWLPPLRGRQLARVGPVAGFPYQRSLAVAWDRIAHAHTAVRARGLTLLPTSARFPDLYSPLTDGRTSPATVPLGQPAAPLDLDADTSPSSLVSLDLLDEACHPHAQRAASAVVSSMEFLALYDSASPAGRARLLDGSVERGPFSFWRRVPTDARPLAPTPTSEDAHPAPLPPQPSSLFAFHDPADFATALAVDLLAFPPASPGSDAPLCCTACRPSIPDATIATLGHAHFVQCMHGVRLQSTLHTPVVSALYTILCAAFGPHRVIADLGSGRDRAMVEWRQGSGAGLHHTPDLVVFDLDGPGTVRVIEVKTLYPCGPSHLADHHTDTTRLAGHVAAIRRSRREEYRVDGPGAQPLPPGMQLSFLAVSAFGAISSSGHTLLREISHRLGGRVPLPLLHTATWAASSFATFTRMAIVHAIRRGLAEAIHRHWRTVRDVEDADRAAADALAASPAPAPPPAPAPAPAPAAGGPAPGALAVALFG